MENAILNLILDLVVGKGLLIVVAVFVLGSIIKSSISVIPNKYIPIIGGLVGVLLGLFIPGIFDGTDIVTRCIYGLIAGWAATGGYETIKNLMKKEE